MRVVVDDGVSDGAVIGVGGVVVVLVLALLSVLEVVLVLVQLSSLYTTGVRLSQKFV